MYGTYMSLRKVSSGVGPPGPSASVQPGSCSIISLESHNTDGLITLTV